MPPLVQKRVLGFQNEPLFCFEVNTVTLLTNFFAEWTPDVLGHPPEVISRIDDIFSNHDTYVRDAIDTAFLVWPVYRSIFAELLYDKGLLDIRNVPHAVEMPPLRFAPLRISLSF